MHALDIMNILIAHILFVSQNQLYSYTLTPLNHIYQQACKPAHWLSICFYVPLIACLPPCMPACLLAWLPAWSSMRQFPIQPTNWSTISWPESSSAIKAAFSRRDSVSRSGPSASTLGSAWAPAGEVHWPPTLARATGRLIIPSKATDARRGAPVLRSVGARWLRRLMEP